MKNLAMLAMAGVVAICLSACNQERPKQPEVRNDNATQTQPLNQTEPMNNQGIGTGTDNQ